MRANGEGSNSSSLFKICSSHSYGYGPYGYLLQYLATTSFHLLARANSTPMKRSVRQLSSVLLIIVVAATLCCQVAVRRGFASVQPENGLALVEKSVVVPVLNATLLKFAAVDLGEAQLNKQIEQLLEGNFGNQGRHRSFLPSGRYNRLNIPARSSRGIRAQLQSPQFNRLWLDFRRNLQVWWRNKRLQSDIMSELISLVRVPIDQHNGLVGSERRYSSCAVVGNSGILLKSEYGELIDGHEVVIRLNNARTGGFEHNVGSKTNISFINSNILHLCARRGGCFCHPYGETVPVVMYICQPAHFLDYTLCNSSHRAPLLITDPRFDGLCTRIVKYYSLKRFMEEMKKPLEEWGSAHYGSLFHYSSGMQAVMLALGICDNVSIFGFGKSALAKHHYHTNQKAELHLHDYEAEYDLYRDLVEKPQVIPFISDKFKLPPVDWLEETFSLLEEQRKYEIKTEKYKKIERHSTCCTPADSCIQAKYCCFHVVRHHAYTTKFTGSSSQSFTFSTAPAVDFSWHLF